MEYENITLEEHRNRTVGEIMGKLQQNDRVCCVRYTGYGKTYHIIKQLINIFPDKQFLILVPAKSLIKTYNKIFHSSRVMIKTYQSLLFMNNEKIKEYFSDINYVICDEAHRLGKNKWRQSVKNIFNIINKGDTKIIGLTATPKRGDKIDIVEDFFNGVETSRFDLLDGIQAKYVPKIDYVVAYCDLSGLDKEIYDKRMEDVDRYEIDKLLNVSNIIKENITKDKLKENLKVVLYVSRLKDIDTAKESCYRWFTEAFPNKNIKVFSLSSEHTDKDNSNYLDEYSDDEDNNSIDIMVSCNKLNEGLHLPKCSIAILLRKTISPIVYFQQIGRAINGAKPVVFDLVNNSSHIKQIENDFEQGSQENLDLSIQSNKSKKIFNECINLISETKDIETILNKYKKKTNYMHDFILDNIDYIKSNMGKITANKIGKNLGLTSTTGFLSELHKMNLYKKVKKGDLSQSIILYNSGYSLQKISVILHRNLKEISSYLRGKGIIRNYLSNDDIEYIKENYYKLSIKEISNNLGVSYTAVQQNASKLGIVRKTRGRVSEDVTLKIIELYKLRKRGK